MIWEYFPRLLIKRSKWVNFLLVKDLGGVVGEYVPSLSECRISLNQSPSDQVWTGVHELLHAISDHYDVGLTEKQVQKLEKALRFIHEKNKGFRLYGCESNGDKGKGA
jgi:hypothetical protein